MTVREALDRHANWLRLHRKPGTAKKYPALLKSFREKYGDRELDSLDVDEIENVYLAEFANLSPASMRNRIAALRSLYDVAERFAWTATNPTRRLTVPEQNSGIKPWLRTAEDEAVLAAAVKPHEQLIVWLLRFTGLRVSEACALKWSDVDLREGRITVRESKTKAGQRVIPLHPMLRPVLEYAVKQGDFVLATKHGTAMVPQYVWRIVKRVGERAEIEGLHPHSLRRTFASELINKGLRLEVVSKLLGHSSTLVTERSYAELLNETIAGEVRSVWG